MMDFLSFPLLLRLFYKYLQKYAIDRVCAYYHIYSIHYSNYTVFSEYNCCI